jgi:hypothetical protein
LRVCWCGVPTLTRGRPVVYSCWWASLAQSSSPGTAGLVTIFCCLKFETPPTWRAGSFPPPLGLLRLSVPPYNFSAWTAGPLRKPRTCVVHLLPSKHACLRSRYLVMAVV